MLDLLLAALLFPLIVALALALLALVTLVPFVATLQMADRRGFTTARWGAVSLAGSLLALAVAVVFYRSDSIPTWGALLPLIFSLAGVGGLWMLSSDEVEVGGRAGRHE